MPKSLWGGGFALVLILFGGVLFAYYSYRRPLPQTDGATYVPDLGEDVLIYRDSWGVPNIYASSVHDLFFAQGYVHAQDRWWQMELQRHIGRGELSRISGEDAQIQATDEFIRALGWGRSAQADWEKASAETRAILEAYSAGVNAYIGKRSQSDLAVQYTLLGLTGRGFEVLPWQPQDTLAWIKAFNWQFGGDFPEAYAYSQVVASLPSDLAAAYAPYTWENLIPHASQWQILNGLDPRQLAFLGRPVPPRALAWGVTGAASDSGLPLLAQSVFMSPTLPTSWYEMGLHCIIVNAECPYTVAGMSLAGIPSILTGYNLQMAWGFNSTDLATQRVYFWERDPADPFYYRNGTQWQILGLERQILEINNAPARWLTLYQSPHGKLISDIKSPVAVSLEWTDPDSAAFVAGFLGVNRAQNLTDFRAALAGWEGAPLAFLYADQNGNLAEVYAGNSWEALPGDRVAEKIRLPVQTEAGQNVGTFALLQMNDKSDFPILLLSSLDFSEVDRLADYQNWLLAWDGSYHLDSPQAVLFSLFWAQLVARVFDDQLGFESGGLQAERGAILALMEQPESPWWDDLATPDQTETRDLTLRLALEAAIEQAEGRWGALRDRWLWSDVFYLSFDPPFLNELGVSDMVNRDDLKVSGDLDSLRGTTWATASNPPFSALQVAAFRMIIDLSDYRQNRSILATGQSGHPASAHYDDMTELWAGGAYRDMLWEVSQVQDHQTSVLRLRPLKIE